MTVLSMLALCAVVPFAFVFFLLYAIQDAVRGGPRDIAYGFGAGVCLLIILVALMLAAA